MKLFMMACIVLFAFIVMLNLLNTKKKSIEIIEDAIEDGSDTCSILSDASDYDLYDDIKDFMTKQTAYIQSIM